MNTSSSGQEMDLSTLITQLLNEDIGRRPTPRSHSSRIRQRSSMGASDTTNAILEIVRGYTSNISEYNRNMNRALQLLESDLYQRISERTGVEQPEQPTRRPTSRPIPSRTHRSPTDFSFLINTFPLFRRDTETAGVVGLTPEQIDSVVSERTYLSSEWTNNRVCPISLDDFVEGETVLELRECRHVFKPAELRRWLERHECCPVCRRNVQPPDAVAPAQEDDDVPPPLLETEPAHTSVRDEPVQNNTSARRNPHSGFEYSYVLEYPVWINDLSGSRFL